MRAWKLRHGLSLAVVTATGGVAAGFGAAATTGSNVDVCSLLSAKQVAAVHAPSTCTRRTSTGSSGTDNYGTWGSATGPHLSIAVDVYPSTTNSGFQLAKKYLGQLPNAKKVGGVGSLAWVSNEGKITSLNFVVGREICELGLVTAHPLKSSSPVIALAKAVAAKLS